MCLTVYMVCSAVGMVLGGFLASDPERCERVVGGGLRRGGLIWRLLVGLGSVPANAVPVLFGLMGFASRALPGLRATCWSSSPRPKTPPGVCMAWCIPAWTSARPWRP
jgi:hypothetical protein